MTNIIECRIRKLEAKVSASSRRVIVLELPEQRDPSLADTGPDDLATTLSFVAAYDRCPVEEVSRACH